MTEKGENLPAGVSTPTVITIPRPVDSLVSETILAFDRFVQVRRTPTWMKVLDLIGVVSGAGGTIVTGKWLVDSYINGPPLPTLIIPTFFLAASGVWSYIHFRSQQRQAVEDEQFHEELVTDLLAKSDERIGYKG